MASQVRICSGRTTYVPGWASNVSSSVTHTSTVEQFEGSCVANGGWQSNDKDGIEEILSRTAYKKNVGVLDHILQSRDITSLNRGNICGQTPLFSACNVPIVRETNESEQAYETAELLLQHGADPNLAAVDEMTPLYVAAEVAQNVALTRLLLSYGAQLGFHHQRLSAEGKKVLFLAGSVLDLYRRKVHEALDNHLLPPLSDIAANYAGAPPPQN